jgi:hypothetical protein
MAKQKPSADRGASAGYNFATGEIDTNPPATPRNPDFSKMPAMKPMASHKVTRPTKRAPIQRALTSGSR